MANRPIHFLQKVTHLLLTKQSFSVQKNAIMICWLLSQYSQYQLKESIHKMSVYKIHQYFGGTRIKTNSSVQNIILQIFSIINTFHAQGIFYFSHCAKTTESARALSNTTDHHVTHLRVCQTVSVCVHNYQSLLTKNKSFTRSSTHAFHKHTQLDLHTHFHA